LFVGRDVRVSTFLSELEHHKKPALFLLQKVPHILPHHEVDIDDCHSQSVCCVVMCGDSVLKQNHILTYIT